MHDERDASFLDRLMPHQDVMPPKRKRGRPRKDEAHTGNGASGVAASAMSKPSQSSSASSSSSPPTRTGDATDQPAKRKRGRPRKRELEPHEEVALIASKQSAHIPPWTVIRGVDRPPRYPETHVFFRVPRRVQPTSILDSPEKPKVPTSRWWHYTRPLLKGVPAKRADGRPSEPLPLAPPGRRPRTRVDYAALQHLQLANRARGPQLDVRALWERRVAKEKDKGKEEEKEKERENEQEEEEEARRATSAA